MSKTRSTSGRPLYILAVALAAAGCGGGGSSNGAGGAGGGGSGGSGGGGGAPAAVSYSRDVKPIFVNQCNDCHSPGAATGYDFANPFDPTNGIIRRPNSWNPNGSKETLIVDPGNVANSFLIRKVVETMLDDHVDGSPMPFQPPALSQADIDAVSKWITDGANNDAFFASSVAPIFGTKVSLGSVDRGRGHCTYCHYPNSPNGMSVINVFDPNQGMVNRTGRYVMKIVAPRDPANSSLMKKLTGVSLGDQMPLRRARLNANQVEILRRWITAGAPNN